MSSRGVSLFLVLAVLAGCSSDKPSASPTPSATSPSPTPTTTPGPSAVAVVYATSSSDSVAAEEQDDLWLYDVAADSKRRLTTDGSKRLELLPDFFDRTTISYTVGGSKTLFTRNVDTGAERKMLTYTGEIVGYSWSPDRASIAVVAAIGSSGSHMLYLRTMATGAQRSRALGLPAGREGTINDEISLVWSASGRELLVTDTHLETKPHLYLMGSDLKDLMTPISSATQGRFGPGETTIVYRENPAGTATPRWFSLDRASKKADQLSIPAQSFHAVSSPDGTMLAYTEFAGGDARVSVFDLVNKTERNLPFRYRDPLWLSSTNVATTTAVECEPTDDACVFIGWKGAGTVAIDLSSGQLKQLALATTMWDGIRAPRARAFLVKS